MSDIAAPPLPATASPLYARFSGRLRAVLLDTMIFLAAMAGVLSVASAFRSNDLSRPLGFAFVCFVLLYEPVLVSTIGGTIGHRLCNLRVVDDRNGGNISFLKAVMRTLIKSVLGWFSFLIMMATRRNQAVHDLLTASTVQLRDPAKASAHHYVTERVEGGEATMPSAFRRLVVIVVYLVLEVVVWSLVLARITSNGWLSAGCVNNNRVCAPSETIFLIAAGIGLLVVAAFCIGWGWRGRLFGARKSAIS